MDGNIHLGRPTLVRAGAQPVTDHLFEPADGGFDAGAGGVAGRLLPGRSSVLGDALQMAVPLRWRGVGRLARHCRGTRRHDNHRFGMTLGDRGGHLGFNRSSQHLCAPFSRPRQKLRQAFSNQASCVAGC